MSAGIWLRHCATAPNGATTGFLNTSDHTVQSKLYRSGFRLKSLSWDSEVLIAIHLFANIFCIQSVLWNMGALDLPRRCSGNGIFFFYGRINMPSADSYARFQDRTNYDPESNFTSMLLCKSYSTLISQLDYYMQVVCRRQNILAPLSPYLLSYVFSSLCPKFCMDTLRNSPDMCTLSFLYTPATPRHFGVA
jgi:hypothetical protein